MNGLTLQDRLYRAAGRTAAIIGGACDLYRPRGTDAPLSPANHILRFPAAFLPIGGSIKRPVPRSEPMWEGIFDAAYTRPGDVLVRHADNGVFFIVAQQPMMPVLCVRALRMINLARPATAKSAGLNIYGGTVTATNTLFAHNWPASILTTAGSGTGAAQLQVEIAPGTWQVLLPPSLNVRIRGGDIVTDDQTRTGIVASAELTDQGWRLLVQQAST